MQETGRNSPRLPEEDRGLVLDSVATQFARLVDRADEGGRPLSNHQRGHVNFDDSNAAGRAARYPRQTADSVDRNPASPLTSRYAVRHRFLIVLTRTGRDQIRLGIPNNRERAPLAAFAYPHVTQGICGERQADAVLSLGACVGKRRSSRLRRPIARKLACSPYSTPLRVNNLIRFRP